MTHPPPTPAALAKLRNIPVPIQALVEAGLSPTQWVMLYLIHFELWSEMEAIMFCDNKPLLYTNDDLNDLVKRYFLIHEPQPGIERLSPLNFKASMRFTDLLGALKPAWLPPGNYQLARPIAERGFTPNPQAQEARRKAQDILYGTQTNKLEDLEAFDALFQAYPSHSPVNGTLMSGRGGDYDSMAAVYARALSAKNSFSHSFILEVLAWAKPNGLITMGLKKFLDSREWLGLQELRDQGFAGSTFDSQQAI